MLKKIISLLGLGVMLTSLGVAFAIPPTFDQQLAIPLTTDATGQNETVFSPSALGIDPDISLRDNVYNLFSPMNNNSKIWVMIRTIMLGVLILYLARAGIEMMQKANDEAGLKKARKSFIYMIVGAFLIRGVTRILGTALQLSTVQGSQGLLGNLQNNLLFQILAFLKGFAFFYAIIMFIYYGFKFMRALEEEAKIKAARTGIINVIVSLILIKIIDFIFYIAQQQDFGSRLQEFMTNAARIAAYILGAAMVLGLILGGVRYITAQGDEAKVKDAQKIITTIFFAVMIIFLFLLVAYQVIAEFA